MIFKGFNDEQHFDVNTRFEGGVTVNDGKSVKELIYTNGSVDLINFGDDRQEILGKFTLENITRPDYQPLVQYLIDNTGTPSDEGDNNPVITLNKGELVFGADLDPYEDGAPINLMDMEVTIVEMQPKGETDTNLFSIDLVLLYKPATGSLKPTTPVYEFLVDFTLNAISVDYSVDTKADFVLSPSEDNKTFYARDTAKIWFAYHTDPTVTEEDITEELCGEDSVPSNRLVTENNPDINFFGGRIRYAAFADLAVSDSTIDTDLDKPYYPTVFKADSIVDKGIGFPVKYADISKGYGVETLEGFSVGISNADRFHWETLQSNLNGSFCTLYIHDRTSGVTHEYSHGYTMEINFDYDKYVVKVEPKLLLDYNKKIPSKLLSDLYPQTDNEDEQGNIAYVTYGRWDYAKMQSVVNKNQVLPLVSTSDSTYMKFKVVSKPDTDEIKVTLNTKLDVAKTFADIPGVTSDKPALSFTTTTRVPDLYISIVATSGVSNVDANDDKVVFQEYELFKVNKIAEVFGTVSFYLDLTDTPYEQDPEESFAETTYLAKLKEKAVILITDYQQQDGFINRGITPQVNQSEIELFSYDTDSKKFKPLKGLDLVETSTKHTVLEARDLTQEGEAEGSSYVLLNTPAYTAYQESTSSIKIPAVIDDSSDTGIIGEVKGTFNVSACTASNPFTYTQNPNGSGKVDRSIYPQGATSVNIDKYSLELPTEYSVRLLEDDEGSGLELYKRVNIHTAQGGFYKPWDEYSEYMVNGESTDPALNTMTQQERMSLYTPSMINTFPSISWYKDSSTGVFYDSGFSGILSSVESRNFEGLIFRTYETGTTNTEDIDFLSFSTAWSVYRINQATDKSKFISGRVAGLWSRILWNEFSPSQVYDYENPFVSTFDRSTYPSTTPLKLTDTTGFTNALFPVHPGRAGQSKLLGLGFMRRNTQISADQTLDRFNDIAPDIKQTYDYELDSDTINGLEGSDTDVSIVISKAIRLERASPDYDIDQYGVSPYNYMHGVSGKDAAEKFCGSLRYTVTLNHINPRLSRVVFADTVYLSHSGADLTNELYSNDGWHIFYNRPAVIGGNDKFFDFDADQNMYLTNEDGTSTEFSDSLGLDPVDELDNRPTDGSWIGRLPKTPYVIHTGKNILTIPQKYFNEEIEFLRSCTGYTISFFSGASESTDGDFGTYKGISPLSVLRTDHATYDFGGQMEGDDKAYLMTSREINIESDNIFVHTNGRTDLLSNNTPSDRLEESPNDIVKNLMFREGFGKYAPTPDRTATKALQGLMARVQFTNQSTVSEVLENETRHVRGLVTFNSNDRAILKSLYYRDHELNYYNPARTELSENSAFTFKDSDIIRTSGVGVKLRPMSEIISKFTFKFHYHTGKEKVDKTITVNYDAEGDKVTCPGYKTFEDTLNGNASRVLDGYRISNKYFKAVVESEKEEELEWFYDMNIPYVYSGNQPPVNSMYKVAERIILWHLFEAWTVTFEVNMNHTVYKEGVATEAQKLDIGDAVKLQTWFHTNTGGTGFEAEGYGFVQRITPDYYNGKVQLEVYMPIPPAVFSTLEDTYWDGGNIETDVDTFVLQNSPYKWDFKDDSIGYPDGGSGGVQNPPDYEFQDGTYADPDE